MMNYMFHDTQTGEDFFVQATDFNSAYRVACDYFEDPQYQMTCDDDVAEMYGIDTY